MAQLKLFLFGAPRLERDGEAIEISLHKAIALLAYLAVTKQVHSRDALATLLWPESDQSSARASLRRTLYRLTKAVRDGVVAATPETVGLDPQADLWLDTDEFQRHVRDCSPSDEVASELSPECLSRLVDATLLYADDMLAGFTLVDSPAFDEWQFFERERLRQSLTRVLGRMVHHYQTRGEFDQAIQYAQRRLALDPLHEPAHCQLMQLYAWSGQQAAALRQYQQCVRILNEELGLSPQPETTELYEKIRSGREPTQLAETRARSETKYVRSGDVHIAYQVLGEGPADVVFVGGFVSHLEQLWEEPELASFFRRLASFSRLILFDKRGVGLSDRVGYPPTLENTMDDMLAVMDAVGCARAVLFGVSEGGTNCALFAATYPERVSGLILYGTLAKGTWSADYSWTLAIEQYDKWLGQMMVNWGEALDLELFAPSRAKDVRFRQWWAKSLRLASSPGEVRAVLEVLKDIDVRAILPAIRSPTLVIHRTGDGAIRVGNGRFIAGQIPGAKYVELPGNDHWWWVGDSYSILTEIEMFLKELKQPAAPDRVLATILAFEFAMAEQKRARETQRQNILGRYQALVGMHIARFRGREIERGDNRFTTAFDGPSRAIQCAIAARMAAAEMGISVRAGLHTGECGLTGGRIGGAAVQLAVNVMERAAIGEVLVSSTVKDLVIGSGYRFNDRGEWILETVPGGWRLFALDAIEGAPR